MTPPTVQFIPAAGGGDYTDYMVSGSAYWIVPDGTGVFTGVSGPTGGSTTGMWTVIGLATVSGQTFPTSQTGNVTMHAKYQFAIQGGFNETSNPFQFCAAWCDGDGTDYSSPDGPGWAIYEASTSYTTRQRFVPIELQSGVITSVTGQGYGPMWNASGFDDRLIFFFDSYTPGDVQNWTAWDGTTTP